MTVKDLVSLSGGTKYYAYLKDAELTRLSVTEQGPRVEKVTVDLEKALAGSLPLPFTPVPFTLQPLVVLVGGAALGSRLGFTSQFLYLVAGVAGLPVFAASPALPQGLARLVGPTGGYLMSYPLAAFVTGLLAERGFDRHYLRSVLSMAAGLTIVFAGGVWWLTLSTPGPAALSAALRAGLVPFIPADLLKIFAAAAVLPQAWRFLGSRPSHPARFTG